MSPSIKICAKAIQNIYETNDTLLIQLGACQNGKVRLLKSC